MCLATVPGRAEMGELTLNSSRVGWWNLSIQENCILDYNRQGAGKMLCWERILLAFHLTAAPQHMVSCTEGLPVTLALTGGCCHFSSLGTQAGLHFFLGGWHRIAYSWGIGEEQVSLFPVQVITIKLCPLEHWMSIKEETDLFCTGLLKQTSKTLFFLEHGSFTSNAVDTK